jgi:hypothetical protein
MSKSLNVIKGSLNGDSAGLNSEGFSVRYKQASEPHRLDMPDPIRTVTYVYVHICDTLLAL